MKDPYGPKSRPTGKLAAVRPEAEEQDDVETCIVCPWCTGKGSVPVVTYAEWAARYPEIRRP